MGSIEEHSKHNEQEDAKNYKVAAFYKFVGLPDWQALREPFYNLCEQNEIRGTILLAAEGINGTIAGPPAGIDRVLAGIRRLDLFSDLEAKYSESIENPFYRLKIKLKKEIVTMGVHSTDPTACVGHYVDPSDWNELLESPDVLVIDTRNDYEYQIGTFKNAINPNTDSFREFPDFVSNQCDPKQHKKVAMFCTGGIRCEKASSYMLDNGFEQVYHLKGGILKYLEEVPQEESLWQGQCFVFDNRVSVKHGLLQGDYDLCHGCRQPITDEDKESPYFEQGVSCARCHEALTDDQWKRFRERQKQVELSRARDEIHIGMK